MILIKKLKSPLRYPGGKAKLYPLIREIILKNMSGDITYCEPFAGGSGLALKLLGNQDVSTIHINDYDFAIYAFWISILNETEKFCEKIRKTKIDIYEWRIQKSIYLSKDKHNLFDVGFATFFLNRTNVSGIINGGVMGGIKQTGKYKINCRFNKEQLINQIKDMEEYREKIQVSNYNVFDLIKSKDFKIENLFVYFDPPYVKKGRQLYKNSFNINDHILLSQLIMKLNEKFIITYDNHEIIKKLYKELTYGSIDINYSAGTKRKAEELLILSENILHNFEK